MGTSLGNIGVKNNSARLTAELKALYSSPESKLWEILRYAAEELPKKLSFMQRPTTPIILTMIGRGYDPNGAFHYPMESNLRNILGNRDWMSEHEFIYRDEIRKLVPPLRQDNWQKISPHFYLDGKSYGRAVDIKTIDIYSDSEARMIAEALQKRFKDIQGIQCIYHTIDGNAAHIHVGIGANAEEQRELVQRVNEVCGYDSISPRTYRDMNSLQMTSLTDDGWCMFPNKAENDYIVQTDKIESQQSFPSDVSATEIKDTRTPLSPVLDDNGLMDVLRIGDLDFLICPVNQVSFSQSSQFMRFTTLRTKGDPKITTTTAPSNITISLIFPNIEAVNTDLRRLIAQFILTPVTMVQSRFIATMLKSHYADHTDKSVENPMISAEDQSLWMVMTDINIRSIQGFPDSYEAAVTLEYFEDRVFGGKMSYLKSIEDVAKKYDRKLKINGMQQPLPAESSRIEAAENYRMLEHLRTTTNPKESNLFTTYYQSLLQENDGTLMTYIPHTDGVMSLSYNDMNIDRNTVRAKETQFQKQFTESIAATFELVDAGGKTITDYLTAQLQVGFITKDDLRKIANKIFLGTGQALLLSLRSTELFKTYQTVRHLDVDAVRRLTEIVHQYRTNIPMAIKEFGLTAKDGDMLQELLDKMAKWAGRLRVMDNLPSAGKGIITASWDIPEAANVVDGVGDIAAFELLFGARLLGIPEMDVRDKDNFPITDVVVGRIIGVRRALQKLVDLYLNVPPKNIQETELTYLTEKVRRLERELRLQENETSIITGISATMNNKMVPMPVIGWQSPAFQHLGRSDWSVTMTLVVKGDEKLHEIMYAMNKEAHLSKQIQMTAAAKFADLDTTFHIQESKGILKTLGITKLLLTAAEIASIQGQVDTYNVTLQFEQADMTVKGIEKVNEEGFKNSSKEVNSLLNSEIIPVLKAIIIREDHPYVGHLLDYNAIRAVIESPELKRFWELFNMTNFHYMDRYNIMKSMALLSPADQVIDLTEYKRRMFPLAKDAELLATYQKLERVSRQPRNPNTEEPVLTAGFDNYYCILDGLKKIKVLIDREITGSLLYESGVAGPNIPTTHILHAGLMSALDEYYSNLLLLKNAYTHFSQELLNNEHMNYAKQERIGTLEVFLTTLGAVSAAATGGASIPVILIIAGVVSLLTSVFYVVPSYVGSWITYVKQQFGQIMLQMGQLVLSNKMEDIAREMLVNPAALNAFPDDLMIGGRKFKDIIESARLQIEASIKGCYPDFDIQSMKIGSQLGIPYHIVDPSFYLYTTNFIPSELVHENVVDVERKIDLLESRAMNTLNGVIQVKAEMIARGEHPTADVIDQSDLDWLDSLEKKLGGYVGAILKTPSQENIQKYSNLFNNTPDATIFFDMASEKAFTRMILINETLKWQLLQSAINQATEKLAEEQRKLSGTDAFEYKDFMDNWYNPIMEAGGYESLGTKLSEVEHDFMNKHSGVKFENYYNDTKPGMRKILDQVNRLAKIKKAYKQGDASSKIIAEYAALSSDPSQVQKRLKEIKNVANIMWRTAADDQTTDTIRIFPTYKLYFIEEDAPEWGIYHDFYDYSAIQEIVVVKDKRSASDTCTIKLSNIAGRLTDTFAESLPEMGTQNLPMVSMMLQPGTSVLIKMGYSNSQIELPVVFYGNVVEVNPGPIVEVVCQSYGAELTQVIAAGEGIMHSSVRNKDVRSLGDVATWLLQQAQGLNHLGKIGYLDMGKKDTIRESGTLLSGTQGKSKIASYWTNLPGLRFNDPRDDNIFLPYNTANILRKNPSAAGYVGAIVEDKARAVGAWIMEKLKSPGFDWFIRDSSIWDALEELTWFNPDTIKTILPYNDNIFPFIPKIRSTLYIGPRTGYYKYTDLYSWSAGIQNEDIIRRAIRRFQDQIRQYNINFSKETRTSADMKSSAMDEFLDYLTADEESVRVLEEVFDRNYTVLYEQRGVPEPLNTFRKKAEEAGYDIAAFYNNNYTLKNLEEEAVSKLRNDVGLSSLEINRTGENPQYKKVQQHHIAMSHTNILSNNITASSEGWANQVRLLFFSDPKRITSLGEADQDTREDILEEVFSLDDDLLDDSLRTKSIFINNIDPSYFDDAAFASLALRGKTSWATTNSSGISKKTADGVVHLQESENTQKEIDKLRGEAQSNLWRMLPSRWRVGMSLLAKEAENMYNGELVLVGDSKIKPFDIMHIIDYTNDMHGSVEVGRVIHRFDPMTGFTTTIKPDLITAQKDKFTGEELFYVGKMFEQSGLRTWTNIAGGIFNSALGVMGSYIPRAIGAFGPLAAAAAGEAGATMGAGTAAGIITALNWIGLVIGAGVIAYQGFNVMRYRTKRLMMIMSNTLCRDSIDIFPLEYKGLPYVAGIDGYRKDGPIRHMYSAIFAEPSETGRVTTFFERLGYANAPYEMEFYMKILANTPMGGAIKTLFPSPTTILPSLK